MKFLKILLMFLLLVGIIVGVLVLATGGSFGGRGGGEDDPLFQSLKSDIQRDWDATTEWNDTVYETSLELLRQSQSSLRSGYGTLVDFVNERACNRIDSLMVSEFSKSDCRDQQVRILKRGLDRVLGNAPQLRSDARVKKLLGTYDLYINLLSFARASFKLSTGFRLTEGAAVWNSFSTHEQGVRKKKAAYLGSPYYANVKNVQAIANGLQTVDSRLSYARNAFSSSVARSIINAFNSDSETNRQAHLQQVYVQYTNEGYSNAALDRFVSNY